MICHYTNTKLQTYIKVEYRDNVDVIADNPLHEHECSTLPAMYCYV